MCREKKGEWSCISPSQAHIWGTCSSSRFHVACIQPPPSCFGRMVPLGGRFWHHKGFTLDRSKVPAHQCLALTGHQAYHLVLVVAQWWRLYRPLWGSLLWCLWRYCVWEWRTLPSCRIGLLLFPQAQNVSIPCTSMSYLRQRASWYSLLFNTNPRLAIGRVVSHDDVPLQIGVVIWRWRQINCIIWRPTIKCGHNRTRVFDIATTDSQFPEKWRTVAMYLWRFTLKYTTHLKWNS